MSESKQSEVSDYIFSARAITTEMFVVKRFRVAGQESLMRLTLRTWGLTTWSVVGIWRHKKSWIVHETMLEPRSVR